MKKLLTSLILCSFVLLVACGTDEEPHQHATVVVVKHENATDYTAAKPVNTVTKADNTANESVVSENTTEVVASSTTVVKKHHHHHKKHASAAAVSQLGS